MIDRCRTHKCRACSKCAEAEGEAMCTPDEACPLLAKAQECAQKAERDAAHSRATISYYVQAVRELHASHDLTQAEVERLRVAIDQEARSRQAAESEVARLQSYIAAGVGGAS